VQSGWLHVSGQFIVTPVFPHLFSILFGFLFTQLHPLLLPFKKNFCVESAQQLLQVFLQFILASAILQRFSVDFLFTHLQLLLVFLMVTLVISNLSVLSLHDSPDVENMLFPTADALLTIIATMTHARSATLI
jgi:hypothetical protein